jgi:hypothetical protein
MGLLAGDELGNGHVSRFHEGLEDDEEDEEEGSEEPLSEAVVRGDAEVKAPLTREDKKAIALLIVLCTFSIQAFINSRLVFFLLISRCPSPYPSHFVRYNPRSSCEFLYTVLAQGNARALLALHLMTSFIMYHSSA